jgi:hypothetical protein
VAFIEAMDNPATDISTKRQLLKAALVCTFTQKLTVIVRGYLPQLKNWNVSGANHTIVCYNTTSCQVRFENRNVFRKKTLHPCGILTLTQVDAMTTASRAVKIYNATSSLVRFENTNVVRNKTYTHAGFELGSTVPQADAITTVPRHQKAVIKTVFPAFRKILILQEKLAPSQRSS